VTITPEKVANIFRIPGGKDPSAMLRSYNDLFENKQRLDATALFMQKTGT
jgi:hypothetical protein